MADIARLGFSVDTSGLVRAERAIESLDRAARGLRDIGLSVDVSGVAEAMRQLDRLDGRNISARVNVDVAGAAEAMRELDQLSANRATRIDVTVTGIDALRSIDNLVNNRSIHIDASVTGISDALRDLDRLAANRATRIDVTVTGIDALRSIDNLVNNRSIRIDANITGINEALRDLDRLAVNRTVRIDASTTGISEALRDIDRLSVNRSIRIDANVTGINDALREIERLAVNRSIRIDASATGVDAALRDLNRLSGTRNVRVDVNTTGIDEAIRGLREIERLAVNHTVNIDVNMGQINVAIRNLERLAETARQASAGLNGLGNVSTSTSSSMMSLGGIISNVMGAIGVATIVDATNDLIKYNAELNLLNSYLGVTREAMQVWGAAGKAVGVEIADVFKDVQEKIGEFASTGGGEAADVFKRLKLDINDLVALSPDQQLLKIADAMSKVKDMSVGEKSFLLESLGNDATRLLPLLDNNAKKLRELGEIMRNSGSIITDDQNAVLQEAYSNMTLLQAASEGATNALGMVGAEILNAFAGDVVDAISGVGESIYTLIDEAYLVADAWSSTTGLMSEDASAAADAIAGAFDWLMAGLAQGAGELVELFRIGFTYLPNFAVAAFQAMIDYSMSWVHTASSGFNGIKSSAGNVFASIVDFAGSAFGSMQTIAGQVIGYIIGRLADMVDSVGGALSSMSVVPGMEDLSTNVAGIGSHLRELESAAKNSGAVVAANFSTMADGIRGSADESARAAQMSGLQAESSKLSAQYAIDNATAMMVEAEGNHTRTIEMGKAERQFARLGSSLDGASTSGKKYHVDQEAVNKALSDGKTKASESAKVTREHSDAMKQATESIAQRTLAVEHGTLAEQYYIERMKGVTDAEARRIVSGNQYLTYLEEQQSLTKDATAAHGGLLDAYRQKLDDAGLGSADKAFDAAKSSTDVAVDAAVKYRESIEAVTKAAKDAAAAVSNMSNAQPTNLTQGGSVGGISAGGGIASSSESAKIAAAAAKHPQVIAVIDKVAKETGTDPAVMKTMAYIESRFNDKAHNPSSASGVYQFVNGTAKRYGLSGKQFDAESNTRAYTKLLEDNASALKRYGIEVTGANLYLAHQQGAGGLKQIMDEASGKGSASSVIHKNMRGNPSGGNDSTAAGFLKGWTDKYNTLEASVKSATSKTADVSVQAGKVATETAKAVPIWDTLNTKTAEAKSLTVEYGGVIEDKVVTAQMRANLEQQYMNGEAQKLIDTANEQAETIGKSGIAIRQNELNQKQFNVSQQAAIINAESALAYAEEEANLRKEMVAVKSPGLAAQYAAGLSDKTLTKGQIESLTGQKLQIEFTKNITELDGRAEKATLTAEAYQRLTLARDGFTESQINGQMAWQQEVIKLEDAAEANSRIAQSFESDLAGALKNGEFNFQNFADTVISEITRLQVIKPLMESLFGADKSGKSGLFGDSEGGIVQTIGSFLGFANGGAFAASGVQEYANGGAFHNSVLNKPTQFFANGGLAVAGEAGSEAVMPLTRIGGKLGVQSTGANVTVQPQIKINIVNNAGAKVETQQQTDNDGNINMTVMINQIEGAISDRARRGQGLANVFKRVG